MNPKKKGGILKGLKYFSQIFEDEEPTKEIQIGLPTDVKHVAHIGFDGPSAQPPSWMDEFRSQNGGYQSAPLDGCVNAQSKRDEAISGDKKDHKADGATVGESKKPKTSRRHASVDNIDLLESPIGSPVSDHLTKNKNKDPKNPGTRRRKEKLSKQKDASDPLTTNDEASSLSVPNIPKKHRRKKSKDLGKRGPKNGPTQGSEDANSGVAVLDDE